MDNPNILEVQQQQKRWKTRQDKLNAVNGNIGIKRKKSLEDDISGKSNDGQVISFAMLFCTKSQSLPVASYEILFTSLFGSALSVHVSPECV